MIQSAAAVNAMAAAPHCSRRVMTRGCKAGADSFLDHAALALGEDAQHLKHGFAGRRGRVEALLVQMWYRLIRRGLSVHLWDVSEGRHDHPQLWHCDTCRIQPTMLRRGIAPALLSLGTSASLASTTAANRWQ
jgi:hypothetical protein